ncbi:MAG TPA: hypothetical protein VMS30_04520, partial [Phycisphaerales bacterium]|nr:hypothetical protein [Phycisphaerales bacterium]
MAAIEAKRSPVCVGLDPVFEKLPALLRRNGGSDGETWLSEDCSRAIGEYCEQVISAVATVVPCIKVQSACFERYASMGVFTLW